MHYFTKDDSIAGNQRWHLYAPVQVYIGNKVLSGSTKDISVSGIHIDVDGPLDKDEKVTLEIFFEHTELEDWKEKFLIEAEVIWVKEKPDSTLASWEMGLRFPSMSDEQREFIYGELVDLGENEDR